MNNNENDVLDLHSLEVVDLGRHSFAWCHVAAFDSTLYCLLCSFLILDLPKLHTISFIDGYWALCGDNRKSKNINGKNSKDNTLIMRSKSTYDMCFMID